MQNLPASVDVEQARADTPGCKQVVHLNNAGASLSPTPVLDTVIDHLKLEAKIGGYEAHAQETHRLEAVYSTAAKLIGAQAHEIALVENATRAWDMAFYGVPLQPGDRILVSTAEYASNVIAALQVAKRAGAKLETIPNDEHGQVDVQALNNMWDNRVKIVAISHVPTQGGLVNPAAAIGAAVEANGGALYILDACQSVGQMPIDVNALKCDVLSTTSRKFIRGPRGAGMLYVRKAILEKLEPPFLDLHAAEWTTQDTYKMRDDARRFETWEGSYALKLGFGRAMEYAMTVGLDSIWERIQHLAQTLRGHLEGIPGIAVQDQGKQKCGIVTFHHSQMPADKLAKNLQAQGFNVSVSPKIYSRTDFEQRNIESLVRASVHYYNTEQELSRFAQAVEQAAS